MRPCSFRSRFATVLGGVLLLLAACAPTTEAPLEAPREEVRALDAQTLAPPSLEFAPDAPVYSKGPPLDYRPRVAHGGGNYLVVWSAPSTVYCHELRATRVRARDGAVLDPAGILLEHCLSQEPLPVVASDGHDFLVAWVAAGSTSGSSSIVARRVHGLTGEPLGNEPLRVSDVTGAASAPALAFDGSHYLVVWSQQSPGGTPDILGARVRASDGQVLEPRGFAISAAPGVQARPAVTFSEGRFLVVWEDGRAQLDEIRGARVRALDGAVLDPDGLLLKPHDGFGRGWMPAVAASGDTFLVTWAVPGSQDSIGGIDGVRVQGSTGNRMGEAFPFAWFSNTHVSRFQYALVSMGNSFQCLWSADTSASGPKLFSTWTAVAHNGYYPGQRITRLETHAEVLPALARGGKQLLAVWLDRNSNQLFAHRLERTPEWSSELEPLEEAPVLCTTGANKQDMPAMAASSRTTLVVWSDSRHRDARSDNATLLGVRVSNSNGELIDSPPIALPRTGGRQIRPAVASDGSSYLVVWRERDIHSTRDSIRAARVSWDGRVLDPAGIRVSEVPVSSPFYEPGLAVAFGGGNYLVTWTDENWNVRAAHIRASDGRLLDSPALSVTNSRSAGEELSVAYGGAAFLVVWTDYKRGERDVYGARVNSAGRVLDTNGFKLSTAAGYRYGPAVAFSQNRFLVVWVEGRYAPYQLRSTHVRASDGVVLDSPSLVVHEQPESIVAPHLAFTGTAYLATWRSQQWRNDQGWSEWIQSLRVSTEGTAVAGSLLPLANGPRLDAPWSAAPVAWMNPNRLLVAYDRYDSALRVPRVRLRQVVYAQSNGARCEHAAECANGICAEEGVCCDRTCARGACGGGTCVEPAVAASCPADVTREATSRSGALVDYPPATVQGPAPLTLTYSQESGALFALGTTSVTATVKDGRGRTASCAFRVFVRDTTAPTLVCPVGLTLEATDGGGALLDQLPVSATDAASAVSVVYMRKDTALSSMYFPVGMTSVTAVGSDDTGNTSTCDFDLTVYLPPGPQVTCPADVDVETTSPTGTPVDYPPASAQGTAPLTLTYSQASGTRFPVGTTRVTATARDRQYRSVSCSFAVHVRDTLAPTLQCPAPVSVEATGVAGAFVDYPPATATDAGGPVTLGYSQASGTPFPVGTTPVTVTATDAAGHTSTCVFDVTVTLPPAPQVSCPADVTAEATSPSGALVDYPPASAQGSAPLTLTYNQDSGTRFVLGTTRVTATVRDRQSRTASCSFMVNVRDTLAPALQCPAPVRLEASSLSGATVNYPPAIATDALGPIQLDYSHAYGTRFPVGTTTVTVTARDGAGNTSTCGFDVTVYVPPAPQVTCPADVTAEATSSSGALVNYPPVAAQGSAPLTLTYSQSSGTRFALGSTPVTATATDRFERSAACTFRVLVQDTTAPTLTCPAPVRVEAGTPSGAHVSYLPATASDAVSAVTIHYSHPSGTRFPLGTTSVTVSASDAAGNTRQCLFEVVVVRPPAPQMTCPATETDEATSPSGAFVHYPPATVEGASPFAMTYSQVSGTLFALGPTTVNVTATDVFGRSVACSFQVLVLDTTAPDLACPARVMAEATSLSSARVEYPPATASDAASSVALRYSHASGSIFPVGPTPVTVTATDGAGNTQTCVFEVIVVLPPAPEVTCPADVTAEATSDTGALVDYPPATARGSAPLALTYSLPSGLRFALGTTPVTVTVRDGLERSTACSFQVVVRDSTPPALICPAHVRVEATGDSGTPVEYPFATATDGTSAVTFGYSAAPGSRFVLGPTPVTVTATDASGNASTCAFTVTVRDTTAPVLTCPAEVRVQDAPAEGTRVDLPAATATDTVSVPGMRSSHDSGTLFPVGTTQVTVTATDSAGNASSCTFPVHVEASVPSSGGMGCGASGTSALLGEAALLLVAIACRFRRRGPGR